MARRLRGPVCFQGNIAGWNLKGSFYIIHCIEVVVDLGENSDQCLKGKTLSSFFCFFTKYRYAAVFADVYTTTFKMFEICNTVLFTSICHEKVIRFLLLDMNLVCVMMKQCIRWT